MKKTLLILGISVLVAAPAYAALDAYRLQVGIPAQTGGGLSAGAPQTSIGGYIQAIYNYALLAVGAVALMMIVIGAIEYTASAGFVDRRSDAKDRILQAVFGLILLLAAAIIFNTINPQIRLLKEPGISRDTNITLAAYS